MLITPALVRTGREFNDVESILDFLSDLAVKQGFAGSKAAVLSGFKLREQEGTTGMVEGFAIPHSQSETIREAKIAVLKNRADRPIQWESLDGQPIYTVIALYIPSVQVKAQHLKLLSKIAVLLMDSEFKNFLKTTDDPKLIATKINDVAGIESEVAGGKTNPISNERTL
ncbi:MAG: PTS sugar transporter subunit IIA [Bifidobacteriaceae bacterium]|jgi:PTS system fructose-specific IIA component|nr:PTS sugar transporter subunit IIA [Bifidobacteriaceae bacterium]